MDSGAFADSTVKSLIARFFVPVRIDSATDETIFPKYGVEYMPTLIVLDSSGKELGRYGFQDAQQMTVLLNKYH
jgi:hypothetical protein